MWFVSGKGQGRTVQYPSSPCWQQQARSPQTQALRCMAQEAFGQELFIHPSVCPSVRLSMLHPSTHPFSASQQWCVPHENCLGSQWVGECCKLPSPPWMVYLPVSCIYVFSQTFLAICRHPTPTFHVQESRGRKCKTWEMALT